MVPSHQDRAEDDGDRCTTGGALERIRLAIVVVSLGATALGLYHATQVCSLGKHAQSQDHQQAEN